jgi:hypothetical protein
MAHALAPLRAGDAGLRSLVQIAGEAMSSFRRFLSRPFGWLIAVAGFLCLAVPLAWATLVIYYSNLPWAGVRIGLAAFDKQSGPTRDLVRLDGQSLQQGNHIGMRPVAIARRPHDLPSLAIDRKRLCAGKC